MLDWVNAKEMKLFEIYAIALRIFKSNFKKIAVVVLMVFFPIAILHTVILQQLFATGDSLRALGEISGYTTAEFKEMAIAYGGNQLLQVLVLLWLEPVGAIAICKITKAALVEEEISAREALGEGLNCIGKYMVAGVFVALLVGLGFGAFIIPGIFLGILVTFYIPSIALAGQTGKKSLQYSAELVKGRWFKTLGYILFSMFISLGFNTMLDYVTFWVDKNLLVGNMFYMGLSYFTECLVVICTTVLFLNREMLVHGKRLVLAKNDEIVIDVL